MRQNPEWWSRFTFQQPPVLSPGPQQVLGTRVPGLDGLPTLLCDQVLLVESFNFAGSEFAHPGPTYTGWDRLGRRFDDGTESDDPPSWLTEEAGPWRGEARPCPVRGWVVVTEQEVALVDAETMTTWYRLWRGHPGVLGGHPSMDRAHAAVARDGKVYLATRRGVVVVDFATDSATLLSSQTARITTPLADRNDTSYRAGAGSWSPNLGADFCRDVRIVDQTLWVVHETMTTQVSLSEGSASTQEGRTIPVEIPGFVVWGTSQGLALHPRGGGDVAYLPWPHSSLFGPLVDAVAAGSRAYFTDGKYVASYGPEGARQEFSASQYGVQRVVSLQTDSLSHRLLITVEGPDGDHQCLVWAGEGFYLSRPLVASGRRAVSP